MDVILLQDVDKVGLRGDVVSVSRGFMRNYLGPRRIAEEETPARVAELEKRDTQRARHEAQSFEEAQKIASSLGSAELRFDVKAGETGPLFGSVTATQIAAALWEQKKVRVDRRKIELDSLKRIGRYQVPIELFTDVTAEVKVEVVPEGGELPSDAELAAMEAAEQQGAEPAAAEAEGLEELEAALAEADEVDSEPDAPAEPVAEGEGDAGEAPSSEDDEPRLDPEAEPV